MGNCNNTAPDEKNSKHGHTNKGKAPVASSRQSHQNVNSAKQQHAAGGPINNHKPPSLRPTNNPNAKTGFSPPRLSSFTSGEDRDDDQPPSSGGNPNRQVFSSNNQQIPEHTKADPPRTGGFGVNGLTPPGKRQHTQSQDSSPRSAGRQAPKLTFSFQSEPGSQQFMSDEERSRSPGSSHKKPGFNAPTLDCSPHTIPTTPPNLLCVSGPLNENQIAITPDSRQSQSNDHRQSVTSLDDPQNAEETLDSSESEPDRQSGFNPPPRSKLQPRSRTSPNLLDNGSNPLSSPNRFMPSTVPLSNPNRATTASTTSFIYPSPHRGPMTPTLPSRWPASPMQGMGSYRDLEPDLYAASPLSAGRTSKFGTRRTLPHKRRDPIMSTTKGKSPHKESTPRTLSPRKPAFRSCTQKPPKVAAFLEDVLSKCQLFQSIDEDDVIRNAIKQTIHEMYTKDVKKGDIIIKQGDVGDAFYVIEWGEFDIIVDQETDDGKREEVVLGKIKKGMTVGETALMYNTQRNATIKATMSSRVWAMDSSQFVRIRDTIKDITKKKLKENQSFLSKIPIFAKMKQHELMNLTQACREVRFKPGEVLMDKKKDALQENDLFIIQTGKAWVVRDRRNSIAICQQESIGEGDFFMRNLLNKEPLSKVKATSEMQCLRISKDDYELLVAPYLNDHEEAKGDDDSDEPSTSNDQELPRDQKNRVSYKLENFHPLVIAGVGSFGHVVLVKVDKDDGTKEVYALKVVEKNKAINTGQAEHMKNERRVMFLLDSPFIVKLYATYQDETCVYFLLESVLGGELFTLLRRQLTFNEPTARFYLGCVVFAFEHMHGHNIIYRDLKPENLLIDKQGYAKLTDFGFAKKRNQTTSLCGTPDYLAPELIQGLVQNFGVDWWCLGVFLYEMLVGRVPFRDTEAMKMYEHILHSRPEIPNYVNWEAQDLVYNLLKKNAYKRLGSGPKGAKDVQAHKWFIKDFKDQLAFSWKGLRERTNPAPHVPELESDEDGRHFDVQQPKIQETVLADALRDDPTIYDWCEEF